MIQQTEAIDLQDIIEKCDSYVQNENNIADPDTLFPQLSHSQFPNARIIIRSFFDNNERFICYGTTTMGTCYHTLYRKPQNNKIYNLYIRFDDNIMNNIDETNIYGCELTQETLRIIFSEFTIDREGNDFIYYDDMPIYSN